MLFEQVIEFDVRKPAPPAVLVLLLQIIFVPKTKISKENLRVDYYLMLKYYSGQCTLLPPCLGQITYKFNPKMQNFKHVLDLNCKKKKD